MPTLKGSKQVEEIVGVPRGLEALGLGAAHPPLILTEQVEGQATEEHKVVCAMPDPYPALVFAEGDIQDPMLTMLDVPVCARTAWPKVAAGHSWLSRK